MTATPNHNPADMLAATTLYAQTLHDETVALLNLQTGITTGGLDGDPQTHREQYERLLFSGLAMHLAGVELPANATPPDRARGVVEALHRIATTPKLFEEVTGATYSTDVANTLIPQTGVTSAVTESTPEQQQEADAADKLRAIIARKGHFIQPDVPDKRPLQLEYQVPGKKPWFKEKLSDQTLTLKVVPTEDATCTVKLYDIYDDHRGYLGYRESVELTIGHLFRVLGVDYTGEPNRLIKKLRGTTGTLCRLEIIGIGNHLSIEHGFAGAYSSLLANKSVLRPRCENTNKRSIFLRQVYLGNSRKYPLFVS